MKGLYLYCVRRKKPAPIKAAKTVGGGEVCTFPFEELEVVASEVDLDSFSSEEIQKKAREDLNWIKEKAQIHEHVIEQAMRVGGKIIPVIPMRFGTIFKARRNLEGMISQHYAKFKKSLGSLEGKQEWGMKVYLNEEVFAEHLRGGRDSSEVEKKTKDTSEVAEWTPRGWGRKSLPKGMDFFAKKQLEEVMKKERNRELEKVLKEVFESWQKLAAGASQGKNLDKAITGREEPMVLNANFLIKEERVEEFQKGVGDLKARYKDLGLIIQESGPWPPYNFV